MFGVLLKLVPTLRWPILPVHDAYNEQLAIDTCISAVQIYFPCEQNSATNYTSLCEQHTWRVACYDNHASTPEAHPDRVTAATEMNEYCRAAGSIGAETVQRQYHAQRRQINSILSSIGGQITSFLSSASITIVLPTFASNTPAPSVAPPAVTTPQTSTVQSAPSLVSTPVVPVSSARSSASTPPRSLSSSLVTRTTSDPLQSTAQSSSSSPSAASSSSSTSSGPSAGLIAGAVIGSVAVLVLFGILLMLILRHKRRKASTKISAVENVDANGTASYRGEPSVETIAAAESRTGDEKSVYQSRESPPQAAPLPRENEMPTSANVWELEGRERPAPAELEAVNSYIPYRMPEGAHANGRHKG